MESHTGGDLALAYDDHVSLQTIGTGTPAITDQTVTSYKVGTSTPDDAVVICQNNELIAVGTGTATVTFEDATYEVTVAPAKISLFMVVGHSVGAGRVFISVKDTGELQMSDLGTEYRYYMTQTANLPVGFDPTVMHVYEIQNRSGIVGYSIDGQFIGEFTHYNVGTNARTGANFQEGRFNTGFVLNNIGANAYNGTAANPFTLKLVQMIPVETAQ